MAHSPQFPRGGKSAVFTIEVVAISGDGVTALVASVEHADADDPTWTTLRTFPAMNMVGTFQVDATAIKEHLRYECSVVGAFPPSAVQFNVLAPEWRE